LHGSLINFRGGSSPQHATNGDIV